MEQVSINGIPEEASSQIGMQHQNRFFFNGGQIYMKDPESAESKEKSNLRFFRFFLRAHIINSEKSCNELKRMKYQFSDFYFLGYGRFCSQFSSVFTLITDQKKYFFKSSEIYIKNVRCPETNEKSYFLRYGRGGPQI